MEQAGFELSVPLATASSILWEEREPEVDQRGLERRHGGTSGSNPSRSAGESLTGVLHAYGRKRLGFAGSVSRSAREVQNLTFEKFP